MRSAGLTGARIEVGGETAAIGEAISSTTASLGELALIMLAITFVLLAIFLRALLAPLYLLAASVLVAARHARRHRLGLPGPAGL